jgi:hypothetical protein
MLMLRKLINGDLLAVNIIHAVQIWELQNIQKDSIPSVFKRLIVCI